MLITPMFLNRFDQIFFCLKAVSFAVPTDANFASFAVNLRQNASFCKQGLTFLFLDRFLKFQREANPCDKESALTQNLLHFASKCVILLNESNFAVYGPIFKIPTCGDSL